MIVGAILRHKGSKTVTVAPRTSLAELAKLLSEHKIGAVPVLEGVSLVGIVSERDIIRCLARDGARALSFTVADAMTRAVQTTTADATVEDAMSAMTAGRFRHMPVMEAGRMTGIISIGDVVKARLSEQAHEVESLRSYVAGA